MAKPTKAPQWRKLRFIPPLLAACCLPVAPVHAQPQGTGTLATVTVNEQTAPATADVSGFGDVPLRELPASATVINSQQLQASGARRLADLTQFDASVTDAYNSPGYWDFLTIRGFTLDNRFNYRREGLPISAETSIPLDNKEQVEILKGTSGIQAGTSAPGGLVNYAVKRPTQKDLREVRIEITGNGSVLTAADLGGRFGLDNRFGYRLNVAHEQLKPILNNLNGHRDLLALAADWRLTRDSVLEAEFEWSNKSQPSQQAFSLLGNTLPAPPDKRLNLNNQPWSQPSVFDALTGTVRFQQALGDGWRWSAQLGRQYLKTDDRLAYGFGCGAEGNFDRFCSDGTYDLYDFRSENERRAVTSANLALKGQTQWGTVRHDLSFGLLASRVRNRFDLQAYNYAGTGNVDGTAVTTANPATLDQNTNRDERSLEVSVNDAIRWTSKFTTWLGLRNTSLTRDSVRTDGSRPTAYDDTLTTPWLAASYALRPGLMGYASWGQGVESQVVPNKASQFTNPGVALPSLKSTQWEIGVKGEQDRLAWQLAWFNIKRPVTNIDYCNNTGVFPACTGAFDGEATHQGLEASAQWSQGNWRLGGGATVIDAKLNGSTQNPAVNGRRPTNVPDLVLRAQAAYRVPNVPGLELQTQLSHEGRRAVTPDNSIELPSWAKLDAGLRYETKMGATRTTWTLGIENLLDRRYWKESPSQYGHIYLFEGAPRTLRLGLTASL